MHADARFLIQRLGLVPHPEGGFYLETFRSPARVTSAGRGVRAASTAIYFLLPAGTRSVLHRVSSDEVWHHYAGDPVELCTLDESGVTEAVMLGSDLWAGERPQHVVLAGVLQGARVLGSRYALVGCTVAPGFEFSDFALPDRAELVARFPDHVAWIEALTRA
jgi:uncharacterized protein